MPEWLRTSFPNGEVTAWLAAQRLAVAFALGCVVAGIYRLTHGRRGERSEGLLATLVLLTVLITMLTLVIGDNLARAFSLVGALAIVRFRTVVEDTRDTAFVIFAVVVGMAVGAGYLLVPLLGMPFVALAAFLFRPRAGGKTGEPPPFTLTVRVGAGHDLAGVVGEALGKHAVESRLLALATARQGAALDVTYAVRLRREDAALALVAELHAREGVQSVEMRQG